MPMGCILMASNNEAKVVNYVKDQHEGTWVEEIAKNLKLHRATVKKYVSKMEGAGSVKIIYKGNIKMIYPVVQDA